MDQREVQIREARVEEIIDLRWKILRAGLPRETADFPGDDEPTTHHFAALCGDQVVGCASFMRSPWQEKPAWQLRGMAVLEELRSAGIGARMLEDAEGVLAREGFSNQLWCNARTPAAKFYERHGWTKLGEEFHVEHAGPHVRMVKALRVHVIG
jgi:predicted GNAT family N-acyltransferase